MNRMKRKETERSAALKWNGVQRMPSSAGGGQNPLNLNYLGGFQTQIKILNYTLCNNFNSFLPEFVI